MRAEPAAARTHQIAHPRYACRACGGYSALRAEPAAAVTCQVSRIRVPRPPRAARVGLPARRIGQSACAD